MSYNTKNYRKQGGDEWVVGGKLLLEPGGELQLEGAVLGATQAQSYFVDTINGNDDNDGKSWARPFKTMAAAFVVIEWGARIYVRGRLTEQLTTPAWPVRDVTIIGVGTTPRAGGAEWRTGGEEATPLLKVTEPGWRVVNMLFKCPTDAPAISTVRGEVSTASHFSALGCYFQEGLGAIWDTGGTDSVNIIDCEFRLIAEDTAIALKSVDTAIAIPLWWNIRRCTFRQNLADIGLSLSYGVIHGNHFLTPGSGATNKVISTTYVGEQGDYNLVTGNYFNNAASEIKNDNGYNGGTNDMWANHAKGTADLIVESPPGAS